MVLYYFIGYFNLWDEGNPLVLPHVLLDIPQIRFFVVVVSLLHSLPLIISLIVSHYLPSPSLSSCHSSTRELDGDAKS
jgi:hypothetical protein